MTSQTPQSPSARAARAAQDHLAQFSDEDMAYHEAGHAVIHHLQGGTVTRLSIERSDPRRGTHTAPRRAGESEIGLGNLVAVLVAGDVASALHGTAEDVATAGARVDYDQAFRGVAAAGFDSNEAGTLIDARWERVRDRLRDATNWQRLESLAQELLRRKSLDAEEIEAILTK